LILRHFEIDWPGSYHGFRILFQGFNPAGTLLFFGFVGQQVLASGFHVDAAWTWIPFTLVGIFVVWGLSYRGIRLSIEYSMVASIAEIVIFVILGIILIAGVGPHNTLSTFSPSLSPTGWSGLGLGALLGYFIKIPRGGDLGLQAGEEPRKRSPLLPMWWFH